MSVRNSDKSCVFCDLNGRPDEYQIQIDGAPGGPFHCDLALENCEPDCNNNGQDDLDDVADGTSLDCNDNTIPDDCEADCNGNNIPDPCDIEQGVSGDCNANYIPDECDAFPVILDQPHDLEVDAGEIAYFIITAQGESLSYQWRHDGVALEDDERIVGSASSLLVILDVTPDDAGAYDCTVTELFEPICITSDPATLAVHGPCPADFDDDGVVAPFDLAMLLNAWGQCPDPKDCPADLNDDDITNAPDLALLLNAWGPCPSP